ncbi:hypothetical protein ACLBXM_19910 [Xanthobacteraceae bacterium A53D]
MSTDDYLDLPDGAPPPFVERRLSELADWIPDLGCLCWDRELPISNLARDRPGDPTLGEVLRRMRCPRCRQPPSSAYLVDEPLSRVERQGIPRQLVNLMPKRQG